jgi:uncharacterized protein with HEPN domain
MNRILKQDESIELTNSRKMVDMRNRVIHGYDSITDETVWSIVINHLPVLKTEVKQMPGEYSPDKNRKEPND